LKRETIGYILSIFGAVVGILGSLINYLLLDHNTAIIVWMFSNPVLAIWAYGGSKKWWEGGLSHSMLMYMYITYTIAGFFAIIVGGML
jgi:hypothetical protein